MMIFACFGALRWSMPEPEFSEYLSRPCGLRVYPNPARDFVNIEWLGMGAETRLVIVDVLGRRVKTLASGQLNQGEVLSVGTSDLSRGLYFIVDLESGVKGGFVVTRNER